MEDIKNVLSSWQTYVIGIGFIVYAVVAMYPLFR